MKKKQQPPVVGYYPSYQLTEEERRAREEAEKPQRTKRGFSRGQLLLLIGCALVFAVSATLLIRYYSSISQAKQATADLREIYAQVTAAPEPTQPPTAAPSVEPTQAPAAQPSAALASATAAPDTTSEPATFSEYWPNSYEDNPDLHISETFQNLRKQNADIVGWLTIEDVLDEPVLQRDNSFYLTHDSTGAENVTGALFLDENCNLRTVPHNLIIHGHNMKEGAMFGSLKKYKVKDAEFYKAHPYITLNTLYEEARYVIFAVAEVSIKSEAVHYLPFWYSIEFYDRSDFDSFINPVKEYSHFQTQVDVEPGDRLLTLATCSGTDDNARLLVVARMIRENEDVIALNQGILSTRTK